ncbi:pyrophosphatase [Pseudovibrio sp. Tun.PSC04-5.I4]|uniref:pyrophosphatase n=1 Tax=Pseudovibrio sp. Tun.PSC04-5.I4 TaxID=1798213 RepID=UPI00088AD0FB|nr:pyrophosphatase [Pseudovibrio sp. Tun.PSC04-5.I4]SDR37697.1 NTP pyrophosphatase, house-cleaning of non-canonical NTPs [Pseudovibrio sp. Tun.PSC04-5.I4]
MTLTVLLHIVKTVSGIYAKRFDINRDEIWYLTKLQEELGELTSAHLKATRRGRVGSQTPHELHMQKEEEAADLLAHLVLYADKNNIDLEKAIRRKWMAHLPNEIMKDNA